MANTKAGITHDISLLDSAGVEYGLMLQRDKNGFVKYAETTTQALALQTANDTPDYSKFNAEEELRAHQATWIGGAGLEYHSGYNGNRYHTGYNIDTRFAGETRLGGLATALAKTTLPTITDGEMDVWTDGSTLTNWTIDAGAITREATIKYSGNYACRLAAGALATIHQDLTGWDNAFRGCLVTVTAWIRVNAGAGAGANMSINDGIGTTTTIVTVDSTYHQIKVVRTLDAAATRIRVIFDNGTFGQPVYVDLVEIAVYGSCASQTDFNGSRYFGFGKVLAKVNSSGIFTFKASFSQTITHLFAGTVAGVDYLFICQGWADEYYYMTTAEAFTECNLVNSTLKYMAISGTSFYGCDTNSTIVSTTNPINGGTDWATSKQIGEDAYNIVSMASFAGLIYAKKSDCKVYYIDASGNVQVLLSGQDNLSGDNTSQMYVWREDSLLIPTGAQDLILYDGSSLDYISPSVFMTTASDFIGQVQAVTGDGQYLYIVVDNGTKVEVMAGRYDAIDGATEWRWHTLNEITINGCASVGISSVYKKRLWLGSDTGTDSFYWLPVTTKYGAIGSDTDLTYQTGGYFITPWMHFNLKGDKKAWIKINLQMADTTANIYWQCHYEKKNDEAAGGTGWTEINSSAKFKTSPETIGYIPDAGTSTKASSTMVRFKFTGVTNDNTKTPLLLGWDCQAIWYPYQKEVIQCSVLIEEGQGMLVPGRVDTTTVAEKRAVLDELYNPATAYPRTFYDIAGVTKYVKALPPKKAMVVTYDLYNRKTTWLYDLMLEVIKLS